VEIGNNNTALKFNFADNSFQSAEASLQDLSVKFSPDGLSFCLKKSGKLLLLKDFRFSKIFSAKVLSEKIDKIIQEEFLNDQSFSKITAIIENNRFVTIPAPLYDKENSEQLLNLNCEPEPEDIIFSDYLKTPEVYNVYAASGEVIDKLSARFGKINTVHQTTVLVNALLAKYKNNLENILLLNVNSLSFEIILISENKLKFCNSFYFHKNEDIIYFLLFTCEQLKLNPENIKLKLSGEITAESELHKLLFEYIRNIDFFTRDASLPISETGVNTSTAYLTLLSV
jgi:hypothetical protein